MKKLPLLLCLLLSLSACGGGGGNRADIFRDLRDIQLTVFVDASLSDAFGAVAARYREDYPEIRLNAQFDTSDALLTRVMDGEPCDIFLSAAKETMDALGDFGYLLPDTRADFLENRLVLAVPPGNPRGIRNFAHMASLIRQGGALFAAANPGEPLGVYTRRLFAYHFLGETALSRSVTYAPDTRETVARIRDDMADGGILYRTDADGLAIVDTADASMCGAIVYSAAVLSGSARPLAATAFLDFLKGPDAGIIFTRAGFTTLSPQSDDWTGPYWEALTPGDDSGELVQEPMT